MLHTSTTESQTASPHRAQARRTSAMLDAGGARKSHGNQAALSLARPAAALRPSQAVQLQSSPSAVLSPIQGAVLQRKCACGGDVGPSGECAACKAKREGTLQRKPARSGGPAVAPPSVHRVLSSGGRPLDAATRAFMEPRFGNVSGRVRTSGDGSHGGGSGISIGPANDHFEREADRAAGGVGQQPESRAANEPAPQGGYDFSRVRLHTDSQAARSAKAVNAKAYTVGSHVVFGEGQYDPSAAEGRRLLAHELAHVVQQDGAARTGRLQREPEDAPDDANDSETEEGDSSDIQDGHSDDPANVGSGDGAGPLGDGGGTLPPSIDTAQSDALPTVAGPTQADTEKKGADKPAPAPKTAPRGDVPKGVTCPTAPAGATMISGVDVDLSGQVTLNWATAQGASPVSARTVDASVGLGRCGVDCADKVSANSHGSKCTTISDTYKISGYAPHLGAYPEATFVSWINIPDEIAFHYYSSHPRGAASHGCVRLDETTAKLIYCYSRQGVTTVKVAGTWKEGAYRWKDVGKGKFKKVLKADCNAAPAKKGSGAKKKKK